MVDSNIEFTRRKLLAATGAIGAAGAGAGIGTSAVFSDEESTSTSIQAGQLDLVVDYKTFKSLTGSNTTESSGQVQGGAPNVYSISDVKPGDTGRLKFCPKIIDNPGWLWIGTANGLTDFEEGQTEPEEWVDATGGDRGVGNGELSEAIQVNLEYCYENGNTIRSLNSIPADYTLADFFKDLESGLQLDGKPNDDPTTKQSYPASGGPSDQTGPCLCISWELPDTVGNEIQTDSVEFEIVFAARQERNNSDPDNPFVNLTVGPGSNFDYNVDNGETIQDAIDAASSGDVISVAPATYGNKVDLNKDDVLLVSTDGPSQTTIEEQVIVSGDGASLCGFTVSPPDATSNQTGEAIRVGGSADNVVITNNTVSGFRAVSGLGESPEGIVAFGGDSDPIENVTISDNTVEKISREQNNGGAAGIRIQGNVDGATVKNNVVSKIGRETSSWAFGIVVSGTGNNPAFAPQNINIIDNDISDVLASTGTKYLGVGFGVEADGTNYLARDNTIDNVNIGVELKAATGELTLTGNSISNIDNSVNNTNNPSVPPLYLGDWTGSSGNGTAPFQTFIDDNTYDVAVTTDGPYGVYNEAIVPQ